MAREAHQKAPAAPPAGELPAPLSPQAPAELRNPTSMVEKPGLLLRLLGAIFFRKVTFPSEQIERLNALHRTGPVVYVMSSQSLLDYLYFNWAFLKRSLPLAVFGQGMRMWPFSTVGATLRGLWRRLVGSRKPLTDDAILASAPRVGAPVVIFLRKARTILPWWGEAEDDPLRPIAVAQGDLDRPVQLVPVVLIWERAPSTLKPTLWDRVFGDFDAPGRTRKLLNFVGNHRHALVQVGDPVDLREVLDSAPDDLDAACRTIRYELNARFHQERRVIKGPTFKTSKQIQSEMLRAESFQHHFGDLLKGGEQSPEALKEQIERYLKEIGADMRIGYIEALCYLLTFLFDRIYAGIETEGLPKVRDAAKRTPLVIIPSHKSHIDYLLISLLFYVNAMVPPQIAAGNNLNFFPLGHVFRRAGAFFLRRSFRQNEVYARAFRGYVQKLLKEGYTLEFFIEGGRSRTGKLLRPRYGLLGHVVDALMERQVSDVNLCPTAIGYEKIIEGKSYVRELSGEAKTRENMGQLLGAAKVLRERFGRVYCNFAEPISLRAFLEQEGVSVEQGFSSDSQRRLVIKRLAYRILGGINEVNVTTASALVAAALLLNPRRGISREALMHRVGALIDYLLHRGAPLASGLRTPLAANRLALERSRNTDMDPRAAALAALDGSSDRAQVLGSTLEAVVDETVNLFLENKLLVRHDYGDEESPDRASVFQVPAERRIDLDYYKNNIVHHFVREGILAATLLRCHRADDLFGDRLRKEAEFLSSMLKLEYVFSQGLGFDQQYRGTLASFQEAGLLAADRAARIQLAPGGLRTLRLLANTIMAVVEGYYVVVAGAARIAEATERGAFRDHLQSMADRLWREGRITFREAVSSAVIENAMTWLADERYLVRDSVTQGRKHLAVFRPGPRRKEEPEAMAALVERLELFLTPQE